MITSFALFYVLLAVMTVTRLSLAFEDNAPAFLWDMAQHKEGVSDMINGVNLNYNLGTDF